MLTNESFRIFAMDSTWFMSQTKKIGHIFGITFLICSMSQMLAAQTINWCDVSRQFELPAGVRLYAGERESPLLKAWYFDVDMTASNITIRPCVDTPKGLTAFVQNVNAIAGINGGFFSGTASVSAVVYPDTVAAKNVAAVQRSGIMYPVVRSFFGIDTGGNMAVNWIYHFNDTKSGIYTFDAPLESAEGHPAAIPDSAKGKQYANLLTGIGGGPALVKNGEVMISYHGEIFWGSGVWSNKRDPRTAIGYTKGNHAVLCIADGRDANWSEGLTLAELAGLMIELGCVEAMNLDGGGSTQMAVGETLVNRPEGGTEQRAVPSIIAIVAADSSAVSK